MTEPRTEGTQAKSPRTSRRPLAGFWPRVAASLLDGLILFLPIYLLWNFTGQEDTIVSVGGVYYRVAQPSLLSYLLAAALCWLYYAFWESSRWRGTAGKQALRLIVVGLDGSRVSFGTASLRAWPFYLFVFGGGIGSGSGRRRV